MNLHEYQAKELFAKYGIAVPGGKAASSAEEAVAAAQEIGGSGWVVKAQVHSGGRGKAGGVKLVKSLVEVEEAAKNMLGTVLKTFQNPAGLPVNTIMVEPLNDIEREIYLGALVDRAEKKVVFMASTAGGMEIETVAAETPELILTTHVDPAAGMQAYQCRKLAFGLGLEGVQIKQFTKIMMGLYQLVIDADVSLIEVNPLIVTKEGDLMALDAKVVLDSNAMYRHADLAEMRDASQEDEREARAVEWDLNYVALDGSIGCMVNGAGLAMATMDLVKLSGGEPANFLDVGGGATAERVTEAFKIILSDDKVKAVLVNIFGGIVRCNLIAEGIIEAVKEVGIEVPVVVRLEGTNADMGRQMLNDSGLNLVAANDLDEAAKKVVELAG